MSLSTKTAPTGEPITLAEAKAHLNVDSADDNTYITTLIKVARLQFETDTGRAYVSRTYYLDLDDFPNGDILLPMPPLSSVTGVTYYSTSGATSTVSSSVYGTDTVATPGRLVLQSTKSWPSANLRTYNGVRVEYVAGYGASTSASIPVLAKQGMLLLIGDMYKDRETAISGAIRTKIPTYSNIVWGCKVPTFP